MPDLSTTYMGMRLSSPVIVGACALSKRVDNIKAAEDAGAGALVIKSLFEEQLQSEALQLDAALAEYENMIAESIRFHPSLEHGGTAEHLMWMERARKAVKMPLIASLNAVSPGAWSDFAAQLAGAGADALELNFYSVITNANITDAGVLKAFVDTLADVKAKVKIPVAVKMSPYFAAPLNAAMALCQAGADGLVLFNRFAQPDIDIDLEKLSLNMSLSSKSELGHTLRWTGLMSGKVSADLCANTGIYDAEDGIKTLLAGANAFQTVSVLIAKGLPFIRRINEGISGWMSRKGYNSIADFRGKVSEAKVSDPFAFERAQYIKALLGFD